MTTIVAVRKGQQIALAADSQTSFNDDQKLLSNYDACPEKIFTLDNSYFAIAGSAAHDLVLKSALSRLKHRDLRSREHIFEVFRQLHAPLKEHFFLRPEESEDDPYESSQMMILIANAYGIFGVYPLREVYEFSRFWAIGSGKKFALGALFALYESDMDASQLAQIAVRAGCEFDLGSHLPMTVHTIALTS